MSVLQKSQKLENKVRLEAYYISEKKLSYNDLTWMLAEKLIKKQRTRRGKIAKNIIEKKAEEIFGLSYSYDQLCWELAKASINDK